MTKFELFCVVFYVLDASYDENTNDSLRQFLSDANPFVFSDVGSADPAVYEEFCNVVDVDITISNSYELAKKYIDQLNDSVLTKAFGSISTDDWIKGVTEYLNSPHKK